MKTLLYFFPAGAALLFYGILALFGSIGAIHPAVWLFAALLLVSAVLMCKGRWWGCIGGLAVGAVLLWMSTRCTGQTLDIEGPLGIVFCVYYAICGFLIRRSPCAGHGVPKRP